MRKKFSVKKLCSSVAGGPRILGPIDGYISKVAPLQDADKHTLSYCLQKDENALETIRKSKAKVIICSSDMIFAKDAYQDKTLVLVPNPKLAFTKVMQIYFKKEVEYGIDPTAVIDRHAKIHPNAYIGPHCYIGKCQIGEGTVIHGNVYLYSGVRIGNRVEIYAGAVIGADGMSYVRNEMGELEKMPPVASVIVDDNVVVGVNSIIMGGSSFGDTIIGKGTKIGQLCHIGHRSVIGKHCLIITGSVIGGSCRIGDYTRISLGACVRDGITIGSNVNIGMGSVVTKDIADGCIAYGVPAKEIREVRQKHAD